MSLFIAVRPDETAVEHLQDAVDRVRRMPLAGEVRWQPPSLWHVTLAFLGDPDPLAADEVAERLVELSSRDAVTGVRLAGSACFGRQIVWMGVGGEAAVTSLRSMVRTIPDLVRGTGVVVDRRPWRPHLTVGRTRRSDARATARALEGYGGPSWDVDEVLLVRSTGGPTPTHHVVASVPLRQHTGQDA